MTLPTEEKMEKMADETAIRMLRVIERAYPDWGTVDKNLIHNVLVLTWHRGFEACMKALDKVVGESHARG